MEVVLDRDAFLKGLQMVQNIVEPRQTLPILANVLLEAEGEGVRVTATDLEVGARVSVPAKVAIEGVDHGLGAEARGDREGAAGGCGGAQGRRERDGEAAVWWRDVPAGRSGAGRFSAGCSGRAAVVGDHRGEGAAGDAHADELRDVSRRDALCAQRCAVRVSGQGRSDGRDGRTPPGPFHAEPGQGHPECDGHRAPQGRQRDHACPRRGRRGPARDHRESVRASDAEFRDDRAADRGTVSELRGRHSPVASGPARRRPRARSRQRCGASR